MDNVIEKLRAGDALKATTAMHGRSRTHPLLPCRVLAGGVFALLAAAVLAAPGPAGGGQECRVVPSGSPWYRASSEHFSVLGNVPSKVVASACTQLERTLSALTAVWSLRLEGDSQVEVLLLPFGSSFDTLTSALLGDPVRRMSSLTLVRRYETSIVASVGVAMPLEVSLAHELTHALVRGTIPRPPYWLDEGLAEFFETLEIKGSTVKVGLPAQDHVYRLRKKVWYPFSELAGLYGGPTWNEVAGERETPVSEAWGLVHYLLLGNPERTPQLARFLARLQEGADAGRAFGDAFGDPAQLQTEVLTYVQRRAHPFTTHQLATVTAGACGTPAEVAAAEGLARVGRLLALTEAPPCTIAECFLTESVRLDGSPAAPWALLGLTAARSGRADLASERFQRAEQATALDVEARTLIGQYLLGQLGKPGKGGRAPSPSEAARAQVLLRPAAETSPTPVDALHAYASSFLPAAGDVSPGIAAIVRVLQAYPRSAAALRDYALLSARAGRHANAAAIIADRLDPLDHAMAREARAGIVAAESEAGDRLLLTGDSAGAIAHLQHALAFAEDAPTRERLQRAIEDATRRAP